MVDYSRVFLAMRARDRAWDDSNAELLLTINTGFDRDAPGPYPDAAPGTFDRLSEIFKSGLGRGRARMWQMKTKFPTQFIPLLTGSSSRLSILSSDRLAIDDLVLWSEVAVGYPADGRLIAYSEKMYDGYWSGAPGDDEALSTEPNEGKVSVPLGLYPEAAHNDVIDDLVVIVERGEPVYGDDSSAHPTEVFLDIYAGSKRLQHRALTQFQSIVPGECGIWRFDLRKDPQRFSGKTLRDSYDPDQVRLVVEPNAFANETVTHAAVMAFVKPAVWNESRGYPLASMHPQFPRILRKADHMPADENARLHLLLP